MTAGRKSDQGSKEEIAKGMSEAGKDEVGKAGGEAAVKGRRGHGADPGKISQGMSEAGSGTGPTTRAPAAVPRAARADGGQPRADRNLAVAARCGPALRLRRVGPDRAWAQTDNPLPPAPPEVQEK